MMTPKLDLSLLLATWNKLSRVPGGNRVFSRLVGVFIPYSGKIGATVEELEPGYARLTMEDRRAVRNHLGSVHAMALANLGELATGLALNTAIPPEARAIVTRFSIEYYKKARGKLTVECRHPVIESVTDRKELDVDAFITDENGVKCTKVTATWLVGPKKA